MSRQKRNFLLRDAYCNWLKEEKRWRKSQNQGIARQESGVSRNQYLMPFDKFPGTSFLYYDVIASFFYHDEPTYAYSVLERWGNKESNDKSFKTYWKNYKLFIQAIDVHKYIEENDKLLIPEEKLAPIRKSFKKTELYQLDGMETLINKLGEETIIKLAIESSFFFDNDITKDRFEKMAEIITERQYTLAARKSQKDDESNKAEKGRQIEKSDKKWYYIDENKTFEFPIEKDGNGNAKVCQMINYYTGYQLEQKLDQKPFIHFIISHLWGRAIDPRFFTSFWNIVLIPAWVNHLLDKETEGDIASKLKSTFKKICTKYNELDKYEWDKMSMSCPLCDEDICRGQYSIQIIQKLEKKNCQKVGKIIKKDISIP